MLEPGKWMKSSRCAADSPQCVEVMSTGAEPFAGVAVRSADPADGSLYFRRDEWLKFIEGAKAGDFDLQ